MKLLLIEDSERLQDYLSTGLRKIGYQVDTARDGRQGLWHAQTNDYEVIILDLMLPEVDGMTVLATLRKSGKQAAVLILTARDSVADRVQGLRAGADDYLTKPFSFDELAARIEALIRRRFQANNSKIALPGLEIDLGSRTVSRDGRPIDLTCREYALLEFLALRRNRVHSRSDIETHVRDASSEANSNVVDAAVYSLRRKIDLPGHPSLIITRRGIGYSIRTGDDLCPSDGE